MLLGWSEDTHVIFFRILKLFMVTFFFFFFNFDYFRVLILFKCIESVYLVIEEKRRDIVFAFHGA